MAPHGRTKPSNKRQVILALECPRLGQVVRPSLQPSVPRAWVPAFPFADVVNIFSPSILTVHAGEDIGEAIRAFFEEHKHSIQCGTEGIPLEGRIFSVSGDVSNPTINIQGTTNSAFEGTYSIATLEGRYMITRDGPVQQEHMKVSFQPVDRVVGGSVVGRLIAACEVQVTVGYVRLNL